MTRLVRRRTDAGDERSWDPPGGRIDEGALAGAGAVVNLCGAGIGDKRWTEARKQVLRDSRTIPTEVLATAVARAGVPVMLNASAVGYYGDTGDRTVDETAPKGGGFLAGLCEEWEAATAPAVEAGSRVVLLRSGVVLAAQGGMLAQLVPMYSWLLGGRLGSGRQYMPWISLDDELAAIRFLLEQDSVSGPVNLTGPEPVTNSAFTSGNAVVFSPLCRCRYSKASFAGDWLYCTMTLTGATGSMLRSSGANLASTADWFSFVFAPAELSPISWSEGFERAAGD